MRQYTIHIPVNYNDGERIPHEVIKAALNEALNTFDGYSYEPTHLMGAWRDPDTGKVYTEHMTRLHIASLSKDKVNKFAKELCTVFRQECMYVVDSGAVEFIS